MEHRINKELMQMNREPTPGLSVEMAGNDKTKLIGRISGPAGTPYENGVFIIDIDVPREYPILPPKMKFRTKVYHPNVSSQTGAICLDILKNEWSPALSMKTVLLSLQALLSAPEPRSPQDAMVGEHYLKDYAGFARTAKEWTDLHARDANADKIRSLCEMGFAETDVRNALDSASGDQNAALEILLSSA